MSDITINNINEHVEVSFFESIKIINDKYLNLLNLILEKFQFHEELSESLDSDITFFNEKIIENNYKIINHITDNYLFCLEQISDNNSDYFIYQKEKKIKKNGKIFKNKLSKIGNKTLLKNILEESDNKFTSKIFNTINEIFDLLIIKKDDNASFNNDYVEYVKENFKDNKNYNKILMVFDNINNILNSNNEELEDDNVENTEIEPINDKDKKKKNKNKSKGGIPGDFLKNLESTKIAQLAKSIGEKINVNDFPDISDPSKLLSSLSNPSSEEGGGIQNLLKFVVGEVEEAFKKNDLNQNDLINEAQNIMGQFQNMGGGFDPSSFLNNKDIDFSKLSNIFK